MEGADARRKGIVVEPGRIGGRRVDEEIAQSLRRVSNDVHVPFHAGLDEPARLVAGYRGEFFDHLVHDRVADQGMVDVVRRRLVVDETSFVEALDVG